MIVTFQQLLEYFSGNAIEIMFKEISSNYKQFIEYSVYLLVLLTILDIISTYIGIKYFNAYEANEKTARLFELFGLLVPSALKIGTVILFGYVIKLTWKNSEYFLYNTSGWTSSIAIISRLNVVFIILYLNITHFIIVLNNINILYSYF